MSPCLPQGSGFCLRWMTAFAGDSATSLVPYFFFILVFFFPFCAFRFAGRQGGGRCLRGASEGLGGGREGGRGTAVWCHWKRAILYSDEYLRCCWRGLAPCVTLMMDVSDACLAVLVLASEALPAQAACDMI